MAGEPPTGWFVGSDDAATYLREVSALWVVWLIGLGILMLNNGVVLIIGSVVVVGSLLWFARPLQRRAEWKIPRNEIGASVVKVRGGGTPRDAALKAYAYGAGPLEQAVDMTDASGIWLLARKGILAVTAVATAVVILQVFNS